MFTEWKTATAFKVGVYGNRMQVKSMYLFWEDFNLIEKIEIDTSGLSQL